MGSEPLGSESVPDPFPVILGPGVIIHLGPGVIIHLGLGVIIHLGPGVIYYIYNSKDFLDYI